MFVSAVSGGLACVDITQHTGDGCKVHLRLKAAPTPLAFLKVMFLFSQGGLCYVSSF